MSEYSNVARLANSNFETIRQQSAEIEALKTRVDSLVESMNNFREQAMQMLQEMAAANKPKEDTHDSVPEQNQETGGD